MGVKCNRKVKTLNFEFFKSKVYRDYVPCSFLVSAITIIVWNLSEMADVFFEKTLEMDGKVVYNGFRW